MMKKKILFWGWILLFALSSAEAVWAIKQVRAKPVLKADKEYNIILLHVADHFVLTVPEGRDFADIIYNIECSFTIAADGSLKELKVENDVDSWTRTFDGKPHLQAWIRDAVLQGMALVPRFSANQLREIKSKKKRVVVFTFGKTGAGDATRIPGMGFNAGAVNANMEKAMAEQRERFLRAGTPDERPEDKEHPIQPDDKQRYYNQNPYWEKYAEKSMVESVKEHLRPNLNPANPPTIQSPEDALNTPPPVQTVIQISLQ